MLRATATLCIRVATRVIDENAPHYLRRDGEEMRTIGPVNVFLIDEPNVSLVDEGCGLKRVTFSLPAHVATRKAMEFVVDQRIQLVECVLVSVAPLSEQLSDLMLVRWSSQLGDIASVFLCSCRGTQKHKSCFELGDLTRFSKHFVYFADMQLFFRDHPSCVVFE